LQEALETEGRERERESWLVGWVGFYLGDHDGGFTAMVVMEFDHLLQGILADDIAVQDEESLAGSIV